MKKLYLLRHGETNHNVWIQNPENTGQRFNLEDPHNTNLTEKGREQASDAGEKFDSTSIDVVYCSPLQRAIDTLQIFSDASGLGIPPIIDHRIEECNIGNKHGYNTMHDVEADALYGKSIKGDFKTLTYDHREFDGEHWQDTESRVRAFLDDLRDRPEQNIFICAHAVVIRFIYKILLEDISPTIHTHLQIRNCSISEFNLE